MKSSRGFECWYVGLGGEIPQHMQVFCTGDAVKKKGGCSQLAFCVVLTLLQLSHQVVVLEESVTAECVCEQHLEESTTFIHQTCRMNPMESTEMFFVTNFFCLDESYMIEVGLAFKKKSELGLNLLLLCDPQAKNVRLKKDTNDYLRPGIYFERISTVYVCFTWNTKGGSLHVCWHLCPQLQWRGIL